MNRASILKSDEKGFVIMLTPYNKDFIDVFKELIPYPHRKWNSDKKVWLVAETMLQEAVDLMKLYFDDISTNLLQEEPSPNEVWSTVLNLIPDEYLDKVFMALASAIHPDHGGSNDMMTKLNIAYQGRKSK